MTTHRILHNFRTGLGATVRIPDDAPDARNNEPLARGSQTDRSTPSDLVFCLLNPPDRKVSHAGSIPAPGTAVNWPYTMLGWTRQRWKATDERRMCTDIRDWRRRGPTLCSVKCVVEYRIKRRGSRAPRGALADTSVGRRWSKARSPGTEAKERPPSVAGGTVSKSNRLDNFLNDPARDRAIPNPSEDVARDVVAMKRESIAFMATPRRQSNGRERPM